MFTIDEGNFETKTSGEQFIECMKSSKTKEVISKLGTGKNKWENWQKWNFDIKIREGGSVTLNALHVAIVMQNSEVCNHILDQQDINDFVKAKVTPLTPNALPPQQVCTVRYFIK